MVIAVEAVSWAICVCVIIWITRSIPPRYSPLAVAPAIVWKVMLSFSAPSGSVLTAVEFTELERLGLPNGIAIACQGTKVDRLDHERIGMLQVIGDLRFLSLEVVASGPRRTCTLSAVSKETPRLPYSIEDVANVPCRRRTSRAHPGVLTLERCIGPCNDSPTPSPGVTPLPVNDLGNPGIELAHSGPHDPSYVSHCLHIEPDVVEGLSICGRSFAALSILGQLVIVDVENHRAAVVNGCKGARVFAAMRGVQCEP